MNRLVLLVGILVAFGLRLINLGRESLWYDETVSALLAFKSISDLVAHTARDIHPPGYYLVLHVWATALPASDVPALEFWLVWPSLLASLLILPVLYQIGRLAFHPNAGLIALLLAAVHPFHIWYAQEVRMYTLSALLGLTALLSLIVWQRSEGKRRRWSLLLYTLSGAAGLYTLYYFAFLLIGLNLAALTLILTDVRSSSSRRSHLFTWMGAQIGILLLWAPWLPIFLRQASSPPVPVWRTPTDLVDALGQSLSSLIIGQTPPLNVGGLWSALALLLLVGAVAAIRSRNRWVAAILFYLFGPLAVLLLVSGLITPLYHIRYFFPYASGWPLLAAAGILGLGSRFRTGAVIAFLLLIGIQAASLMSFWTDSRYASDDHRGAVELLAEGWRPGDAILVNAGWVYPALEIYWPETLHSGTDSLPPPLLEPVRMNKVDGDPYQAPRPVFSGSVDGPADLGWGLAGSDFYTIESSQLGPAIERIVNRAARIWHYRLYDTVSDPDGLIRSLLSQQGRLDLDLPFPGRDFLRLQRFTTGITAPPCQEKIQIKHVQGLSITGWELIGLPEAGSHLYANICWSISDPALLDPADMAVSLRLYQTSADDETLVVQKDLPFGPGVKTISGERNSRLLIPIPAALPPLSYRLTYIVYAKTSGVALDPLDDEIKDGKGVQLDTVEVNPLTRPFSAQPIARFDYIDLLEQRVGVDGTRHVVGEFIWMPRFSPYRDTYRTVLTLEGEGELHTIDAFLGGERYPSGLWPADQPVLQRESFQLPDTIKPGRYQVFIHLERASDRMTLSARYGPGLLLTTSRIRLGVVDIPTVEP